MSRDGQAWGPPESAWWSCTPRHWQSLACLSGASPCAIARCTKHVVQWRADPAPGCGYGQHPAHPPASSAAEAPLRLKDCQRSCCAIAAVHCTLYLPSSIHKVSFQPKISHCCRHELSSPDPRGGEGQRNFRLEGCGSGECEPSGYRALPRARVHRAAESWLQPGVSV